MTPARQAHAGPGPVNDPGRRLESAPMKIGVGVRADELTFFN